MDDGWWIMDHGLWIMDMVDYGWLMVYDRLIDGWLINDW